MSDKDSKTYMAKLPYYKNQYATRAEYSATIKVKESSTIYEQGEVSVTFTESVEVSTDGVQDILNEIAANKGEAFGTKELAIAALQGAALPTGILIDKVTAANGETRAPEDVKFTVTVKADEDYILTGAESFTVTAQVEKVDQEVSTDGVQDILNEIAVNKGELMVETRAPEDVKFTVTVKAAEDYILTGAESFTVTAQVEKLDQEVSTDGVQTILDGIAANDGKVFDTKELAIAALEGATLPTGILIDKVTAANGETRAPGAVIHHLQWLLKLKRKIKTLLTKDIQDALDKAAASKTYFDNTGSYCNNWIYKNRRDRRN
ncbi:hypothetical protein FQA39_LY12957 [Lamprigera yunnana]|nr:hypothetical protein FQA39_LY12957 [Lamprigera yunnana]